MLGAGDAGSSSTVEDDTDRVNVLPNYFESIEQGRSGDDRSAVLVVVEYRNPHGFAKSLFDLKAVGGFDVFEVDATECGLEQLAEFDDLFGIVAVDFDVEDIDIGKALEENSFAFHDRLASESADIAQAEHRGSVAQDGDQISAAGVFESILRILLDFETRHGHTRRVGQTKIALRAAGLGRCDFDFPRTRPVVIVERLLPADRHDFLHAG